MIRRYYSTSKTAKTRRGIETRQRIIDSAISLFAQKGYSRVRIIDILNSANVSPGAFYNYFSNKEELFLEIVKLGGGALIDYFKNHILPETEEKDVKKAYSSLVQGIDYFLDFVEKNRQIFQILFQEMIYRNPRVKETIDQIIKEFVNLFRHQIDKGIQKGMINITDSEIASWSFVCSILGMALTYLENPSIERAKLARTISELVLLGLFRREVPQKTI